MLDFVLIGAPRTRPNFVPDHNTLAILVWEYGGGAAGSSEHYVYVIEAGSKKSLDKPALAAAHCDPSISWSDYHTLLPTAL